MSKKDYTGKDTNNDSNNESNDGSKNQSKNDSNSYKNNPYGEEYTSIFDFLGITKEEFKKFKKEFSNPNRRLMNRQELLDHFTDLMNSNNDEKLKREVYEKAYYVFAANAPDVFRLHAIVCIQAQDYKRAIESVRKILNNYDSSIEILGILHYAMKDYRNASAYLKHVNAPKLEYMTNLFKSVSDYKSEQSDMYKCSFDLEKIVDKSSQANNFLGTIFFNKGEYSRAQDYFMQEVFLLKDSDNPKLIEESRINSLRSLYVQDKVSALSNFSEFYAITKSSLSAEELIKKMELKKLAVPHYSISSKYLVKITKELLV
jgi:TolA-binding protein